MYRFNPSSSDSSYRVFEPIDEIIGDEDEFGSIKSVDKRQRCLREKSFSVSDDAHGDQQHPRHAGSLTFLTRLFLRHLWTLFSTEKKKEEKKIRKEKKQWYIHTRIIRWLIVRIVYRKNFMLDRINRHNAISYTILITWIHVITFHSIYTFDKGEKETKKKTWLVDCLLLTFCRMKITV